MNDTDLKPGDIVQHAEHGYGVVLKNFSGVPTIYFAGKHGHGSTTSGFTGWERIETVRPGHVQVRVDDLDPGLREGVDEAYRRLCRAWGGDYPEAQTAQRVESTPPADEQNASATEAATYQCPWCSTDVTFSLRLDRHPGVGVMVWVAADGGHACPPAQPDEPTEFGARVTVTLPDGTREKWCRLGKHHPAPWLGETYDVPGEEWSLLCGRGTVTIGWDE